MKICKLQRAGIGRENIALPMRGSLSAAMMRNSIQPGTLQALNFTYKWYRSEMRSWAGWWRDSFAFALYRRDEQQRISDMALRLALHYRELALTLKSGL